MLTRISCPLPDNNTLTTCDDRTRLQALSVINDCYKYIMDLTTNGVVITDAIKFVQTNKEKLVCKEDKDSKESAYNEDEADIEEKQVETKEPKDETTTNQVF